MHPYPENRNKPIYNSPASQRHLRPSGNPSHPAKSARKPSLKKKNVPRHFHPRTGLHLTPRQTNYSRERQLSITARQLISTNSHLKRARAKIYTYISITRKSREAAALAQSAINYNPRTKIERAGAQFQIKRAFEPCQCVARELARGRTRTPRRALDAPRGIYARAR